MPRLSQFNGTEIFLDANILLYDFTAHPRFGASCHKLIEKTELGQLRSITSHWVITEVVHKLMLLETCDRFHLVMHESANYLKKHPRSIQTLSQYRKALDLLIRLPNLIIKEIKKAIVVIVAPTGARRRSAIVDNGADVDASEGGFLGEGRKARHEQKGSGKYDWFGVNF